MSISLLLAYISIFSPVIPLTLAIIQWNRIPRDIASLRWLLIAALVADPVMWVLSSFSVRNLWIGDVFMFIQFTILLYIFGLQFEKKTVFKIVYLGIGIFYLCCLIFLSPDGAMVSLVGSNAVDGLVLIIASLVFFYKLLTELKVTYIHRLPVLWISFATLFYYSGSLFVFLAASYLEQDPDALKEFWILHNVLNTTKNILFAVALWQSYRTLRYSK